MKPVVPACGTWKRVRHGWQRVCRTGSVRAVLHVDEQVVGWMEAGGLGPIFLRRRFDRPQEAMKQLDRSLRLAAGMHRS